MNTRSRWGSSSAACATSRPARPIRSARPRRGSPRMRLSPVCARRSNRTRCAARCCWRRAACATSPAGSTQRCTLLSGTTPRGTPPIRCTSALTRSSRAVWRTGGLAVGILLSGGPPVRLSAQTIDTIVVVNHNIFDLSNDAPGLLARLANALHVTTRAGVIRRTLFVNPGDRYDSARVAESERALRALYVFSRVRLDTTRIAGRLALRVETSDGWSTKPQFGYSSAGGDATWLAGLVEENLLGTATALAAVYNKTPDRSVVDLRYGSPHFFGRRTRVVAEYASKSDGKRGLWFLGVPFYETGARRALGTDGEAAAERVLVSHIGCRPRPSTPSSAARCGSASAPGLRSRPPAAASCGCGRVASGAGRTSAPRAPSCSHARRSGRWGRGWMSGTCGLTCSSASTRTPGEKTWTSRSCCTSACGRHPARGAIRRSGRGSAPS